MVMNKALKSKNKPAARKAAATSKKTTKVPIKATGRGRKAHEEPQELSSDVIRENNGEAAQNLASSANGNEENLINGNSKISNENESNGKTDEKTSVSASNTETVNATEENSTLPVQKTKGRQKKDKENQMEITEETPDAVPASEESPVPEPVASTAASRKRKAAKEVKEAEQSASEDEQSPAIAGPSSSKSKSRKKKVETVVKVVGNTKNAKEKAAPVSKTKAKRQKIVLDIPPVRSVSGKVFVIGENDVGQLGLEDVEMKKRPTMLDLPYNFTDIAAGGMHSVCLTESGEVITFGCNDEGALGRITADDSLEGKPLKVDIPEKIVQVSAGDSHSAALSESGHVFLWGNFRSGDGPMGLTVDGVKQPTPVRILNDVTIVKISSGTEHLACLSNEGLIYTLGCGENGQLGRLPKHSCHNGGRKGLASLLNPAQVHIGNRPVLIEDVWTGSYNTFLKAQETGSIYAFGLNNYQQLGCEKKNDEDNFKYTPKHITAFNNNTWLRIVGGQHHSLALDREGLVYSLGRGDYGRLGLGESGEEKGVPTVIPTLQSEKCTEISCGNCVSFSLTNEGSVYSWGFGDNHQLGHGNDEDCHIPKRVEGNFHNSWKAHKVSGGGQHTLILAVPKEDAKNEKKK